jgi:hypothetical protein
MRSFFLELKWTVSRGRDTYGYNICSLYVDGKKVSSCNGGNYDMEGTALGLWVQAAFAEELVKTVTTEFYGLCFANPHWKPSDETLAKEKEMGFIGLDRYRDFYSQTSKVPTEKHIIPLIDGACGKSEVIKIINHLGYAMEYIPVRNKNLTIYKMMPINAKEEEDKT